MSKPISVLFVASEVIPFVKVGGIADVAYSLPLALRERGNDVRVMLPKYGSISERKNKIHEINRLREIPIPMGDSTETATVKSSSMNNPKSKVQAYITTSVKHFDSKKGIYHNLNTGEPYPDNDERFIFFNRTVVETCSILGWYPDLIHCNDWQTALIPAMAKTLFPEGFKNTKFVFTIHNIADQGEFPVSSFKKTGLPKKIKNSFTHKRKMNFMKGALEYADYVTTVSESYAELLKNDSEHTNGLNEIIKKTKNFKGVLNGIDPWAWNPEKDKRIKKKFTKDYWEFKKANKKEALRKFELDDESDAPLIGMISKIDELKGVPLLIKALPKILNENVKFVFLGDGDIELKKELRKLSRKYKDKFGFIDGFSEDLAHKIEAGADIFLLPSLVEPCGLNALYSLAYGTLPIVRKTGGLQEMIKDLRTNSDGNGFVFEKRAHTELANAVKKALELYEDKDKWEEINKNNMEKDYSWNNNVGEYEEIYKLLV